MSTQLRIAAVGAVFNPTVAGSAAACFVDIVVHRLSRCLADGVASGAVGTARSDPAMGASMAFNVLTGTSKTTISRLLGRVHDYLIDETVGISPATSQILSYPKPPPTTTDEQWRQVETSTADLGPLPAHPSATVEYIVLVSREHSADGLVHAGKLGTLDAVAALFPETSTPNRLYRGRCTPSQTSSNCSVPRGPLVRLTCGEASDLVPLASGLLEDGASGLHVRREPLGVLEVDGEALRPLPPERVVRLSAIVTAVSNLALSRRDTMIEGHRKTVGISRGFWAHQTETADDSVVERMGDT